MSSIIFFLIFIPILSIVLLSVNFIFAPHNPYKEKKTPFECGYHSFLSQNRTQFTISFFIFALLFLIFDLEIVLIYPYTVSSYANNVYGLTTMIVFTLIVTVGFIFELGKNALKIESKQTQYVEAKNNIKINMFKPLESGLISPRYLVNFLYTKKEIILFTFFTIVLMYVVKIPVKDGLYVGVFLVALYSLLFRKVKSHFNNGSYSFDKWDILQYFLLAIMFCCLIYGSYVLRNALIEFFTAFFFVVTMPDKLIMEGAYQEGIRLFSKKFSGSFNMEGQSSEGSKGKEKLTEVDAVESTVSKKRPRPLSTDALVGPSRTNPALTVDIEKAAASLDAMPLYTRDNEFRVLYPNNPVTNPRYSKWSYEIELALRTVEMKYTYALGQYIDLLEKQKNSYLGGTIQNKGFEKFIYGIFQVRENSLIASHTNIAGIGQIKITSYVIDLLRQEYDKRMLMSSKLENSLNRYFSDSNYVDKRILEFCYYHYLETSGKLNKELNNPLFKEKVKEVGWTENLGSLSNTAPNRSKILAKINELHNKVNWN